MEAKPSDLNAALLEAGTAHADERQLPHVSGSSLAWQAPARLCVTLLHPMIGEPGAAQEDEEAVSREREQAAAEAGAVDAGEHFWDFIKDGLNWLLRSTTLQAGCWFPKVHASVRTSSGPAGCCRQSSADGLLVPSRLLNVPQHTRVHMQLHVGTVTCCVQGTFFLAVTVAGRLGTASLAAHQVLQQLCGSLHCRLFHPG